MSTGHEELAETRPDEAGQPVEGPRLLRSITLRNLLSFGPETPPLELRSLNVLIGPNGSGKSNLLDAVDLLRSLAKDPRRVIARGGGVQEWIWKGRPEEEATIQVIANVFEAGALEHQFAFVAMLHEFVPRRERIEGVGEGQPRAPYFVRESGTAPSLVSATRGHLQVGGTFRHYLSILGQREDPEEYPALYWLAAGYRAIRLYRDWPFGRGNPLRTPQMADLPNDRLAEDFSNLSLVLNRLRQQPRVKANILERLRDLYEGLTDFDVSVQGGTVQVIFTEGDYVIPATRLSDGSLRYLCLLAILCDPDPPPLIGIEEPELGLHPDLVVKVADLLIEASARTQLIVTTHSEMLVDALTEAPESVVVCEKHQGRTAMSRLSAEDLKPWLDKFGLGKLWTQGQLGGTRW